jgi:peptidyl-dipeptidase Dcp
MGKRERKSDMIVADKENPVASCRPPFGLPPFASMVPSDFLPAFAWAFKTHLAEVDAIASAPAGPSFENTIAALERSGGQLRRISRLFFLLAAADTNDKLQEIEREIAPRGEGHWTKIYLDSRLYHRIAHLFARRAELDLTAEQARVLERYHTEFTRAGAALDPPAKARLAQINERLALLGTTFGQNVLADEKAYALVLDGEADLAGLPDFVRAAARAAAEERGFSGKHIVSLARSLIEPFLQFSSRRDLREKAFLAWTSRGDNGGATDNKAIIAETLKLRAERARLLGHANFAEYRLADQMAKTPQAVRGLLDTVWRRACAKADEERARLQALIAAEGGNFSLAPWDWRYYAEKLRRAEFDLDEAVIKPYLTLDAMIDAAFEVAHRLFGLSFAPMPDTPRYHPDIRMWEVTDAAGGHVGVFIGDYFARPSKRSGAWMTALRDREKLSADVRPIVVNVMNFAKPEGDGPALLSFDDTRTLFHEFGHALHGLLSDATYPLLAGTRVPSDFVELPSQLYEHWLECPEVLGRFARHWQSGEPMPRALVERVIEARTFNQGFATVGYVASAVVDLDFHEIEPPAEIDPTAFEAASLARIGMPAEIVMRHRPPHFAHVFSGGSYAAGYYSYLWSEILDADAFAAFLEAGDAFDAATARRLKEFIYSAGNLRPPDEAYTAFRGRLPGIDALMKKRGLDGPLALE